jgi:hypothetical protein
LCAQVDGALQEHFASAKKHFITAVPLSNHDAPDGYWIEAQLRQVNRPGHVFEQTDTSSRTEHSGDPGRLGRFRHDNEMLTG